MRTAKQILNKYIKGDLERDYNATDLDYHTIKLSTALEAMEEYKQVSVEPEVKPEIAGVDLIKSLATKLKPQYENDVFTWHKIKQAITEIYG